MSAIKKDLLERKLSKEECKAIDTQVTLFIDSGVHFEEKVPYGIIGRIKKLNESVKKPEIGENQREVPPSAVKQPQEASTQSIQKPSVNIFKNTESASKDVGPDLEFLKNPTSLFSSMVPKDTGPNIFICTPNTINLFTAQRMTLEAKQQLPPTNINFLVGLAGDANGDELQSVTQQSAQKQQELTHEPAVSYDYANHYSKVFSAQVPKFKTDNNPLLSDVSMSIEKPVGNNCWLALVVRSKGTGLIVYQAILIPNRKIVEPFMNKKQNCRVEVLRQKEGQDSERKFIKEFIKIQFNDGETCDTFKKILQDFPTVKDKIEAEVNETKVEQTKQNESPNIQEKNKQKNAEEKPVMMSSQKSVANN